RGVGDREGDVQHAGERLRQQGLAGARGAQQEDVGLRQLDGVLAALRAAVLTGLDPFVVVVHRDGEGLLGRLLAHHVPLEELVDLAGLGELLPADLAGLGELFLDDLVAEIDALVADVHTGPCDELLDLLLALAAERALEQIAAVTDACHGVLPLRLGDDWTSTSSGSWCCLMSDGTLPGPSFGPPLARFAVTWTGSNRAKG